MAKLQNLSQPTQLRKPQKPALRPQQPVQNAQHRRPLRKSPPKLLSR